MGFTCSSNRRATRSYRASSSTGPATAGGAASLGAIGGWAPSSAKRMAPPMVLPIPCHGVRLCFTTVTVFPETTTSTIPAPGMAKRCSAKGLPLASAAEVNRRRPPA